MWCMCHSSRDEVVTFVGCESVVGQEIVVFGEHSEHGCVGGCEWGREDVE